MEKDILKMFVFLSEILNRRVINAEGKVIGKVVDLRAKLGELFPAVVYVCVRQKEPQKRLAFPWHTVESINGNVIRLKQDAEEQCVDLGIKEGEILLRDEILDKQVVDTYGAKIERANDLHLLLAQSELRLVHVDFGIRGIFRRLRWLRYVDALTNWFFAYQIPDRLLSWKYIQPLSHDPHKKALKLNLTHRKLSEIHPSDLADILEELDKHKRSYVFHALDVETQADALEEVNPETKLSLLEGLSDEHASDVIEEMEPDQAADLLSDLPEEKKNELIEGMERDKRVELEELLKFEEGTAGSIMTPDFLACLQTDTVGKAMEIFKQSTDPLDTISYIYVKDNQEKLVGVVTLRELILNQPETPVDSFMNRRLIKLKVDDSVKEVAETFKKYNFLALPVVDEEDRMKGIITMRDGIEAIFPEFKE
ncbi:MAG: CBS domain-containing protein [candidate division Zixibacteria bacterium]|nr:CBS domain-containing protein [candidate division Zixibacteria bacterium]